MIGSGIISIQTPAVAPIAASTNISVLAIVSSVCIGSVEASGRRPYKTRIAIRSAIAGITSTSSAIGPIGWFTTAPTTNLESS